MLKTCYQPKFDHVLSMWYINIIFNNRSQIAYFKTMDDAIRFRIYFISKLYPGGILAHEQQFKVR